MHPARRRSLSAIVRSRPLVSVATAGSIVLILALAGILAASSITLKRANDELTDVDSVTVAYLAAQSALAEVDQLEDEYSEDPTERNRVRFRAVMRSLDGALRAMEREGVRAHREDGTVARMVLSMHRRYLAGTARVEAAIETGDVERADTLEQDLTAPIFDGMQRLVSRGGVVHALEAQTVIASQRAASDTILLVALSALAVGAALLGGLRLFISGHRRAEARRAAEELARVERSSAELRRALGQVASLEARHRSILESTAEGIYGIDAGGRVTFLNGAAARMTGYAVEELMGRPLHRVVQGRHEDGRPYEFAESPVSRALAGAQSQPVRDEVYWRSDGTSFPVEYTASPLIDGDSVAGAVVIFRDVSDRREVDRLKDEFVSVVSHELRTPLTSVRGSLGLLAAGTFGPLPAKGQRMLDIAVQNTDRLVRLINDILEIERMESGHGTLDRRGVEFDDLVSQSLDVVAPVAAEAGVELRAEPCAATVWADSDRVIQALTNLLGNAIKFTPTGGLVELGADQRDGELVVWVRDQGRGIPADKLEVIFGRFEQVDASDSRQKGGSGLGLAISRAVVEQHGGRIWAESRVGEGSMFSFTLPSPAVPAPGDASAVDDDDDRPVVLVCDDDEAVLDLVGTMLSENGYRPILVASGEEAIERAAAERPSVVMLDLMMPGLSGWETAAELARRPETCEVPILILSVLSPEEAELPTGEVVGWIEKPLDSASLLAALEDAAARGRGALGRVLVVEDDADLAGVLCTMFERHGVETAHAATAAGAIEMSRRLEPNLVVLDLGLPDSDGFAVMEALSADERLCRVPVVVHTARHLEPADRARLGLGKTHCVTKGSVAPEVLERLVVGLMRTAARGEEVVGGGVA